MFRANNLIIAGMLIIFTALLILPTGCGGGKANKQLTAEEQFKFAMKKYQDKNYIKAIEGFQKVVYNFSGASNVDSAQYYIAMSYYLDKDYYLAAAEFERLVNMYPGSPFIDNSKYMSGLCYYKSSPGHSGLDQVELVKALEALEDFVTDYPGSDVADDAKATIKIGMERLAKKRYDNGRMYFRLGYYKSAKIYYQSVIDEHTDSEWSALALYYMAEIEIKRNNYTDAQEKFSNFLIVYPEHELSKKAKKKLAELEKELAESTESR